ncbi:MAG: hypothetical protein RBT60_14745, partial [Candidatus Krumholzibacteria bacterium]|nr:hypothetical protein [Candidatus Krumholzibacteria bacterium]
MKTSLSKCLLFTLVCVLVLGSYAISLQPPSISVRQFKGLNTKDGDLVVGPEYARIANDIDFSEGTIKRRLGYDSISTISGQDSILNIFAMYDADGQQRVVFVTDSAGVGYGNVYVTPDGSANLDSATRISTYWGIQQRSSGAQYGDAFYLVNGTHKGIVWDGENTRQFPMRAPGEPTIVPIDGVDSLNGEYRYLIGYKSDTSSNISVGFLTECDSMFQSVVTQPVRVKNGKILMTNFPWPACDSSHTSFPDGIRYVVLRTRANPGALDDNDSMFYVASFLVPDADSANKYVLQDSLGTGGSPVYLECIADPDLDNGTKIQSGLLGVDSVGNIYPRLGAPGYYTSTYVAYDSAYADTSEIGIFCGIPAQQETLGVAYALTYIDTVTGFESDTGRSLCVFNDTGDGIAKSHTLFLPAAQDSGLVRNLYRALIMQITYDTSYWNGTIRTSLGDLRFPNLDFDYDITKQIGVWEQALAVDTVVITDYYLVAQIGYADTSFLDDVRYDSLKVKRRYERRVSPSLIDNIFAYQSRLWGLYRSNLYFSKVDSAYSWGAFDFFSLNRDDGDENTVAYPARGVIRVAKNNSMYNVYQDSDGGWSQSEITQGYGIIAGESYATGVGGRYYLTGDGVMRENDGQYLERTQATSFLSGRLDNFDKLPVASLREAVGFYFDRKYMISVPRVDSLYVYDERSGGWSVWTGGVVFS